MEQQYLHMEIRDREIEEEEEEESEEESDEQQEKEIDIYDEIISVLSKVSYYCVHIVIILLFTLNFKFITPVYAQI